MDPEIKAKINTLLLAGEIDRALKTLIANVDSIENDEWKQSVILVTAQYQSLIRNDLNGLLTREEQTRQEAKIIYSIQKILENISEHSFSAVHKVVTVDKQKAIKAKPISFQNPDQVWELSIRINENELDGYIEIMHFFTAANIDVADWKVEPGNLSTWKIILTSMNKEDLIARISEQLSGIEIISIKPTLN